MENEQARRFLGAMCRLRADACALPHIQGLTTGEFIMLNHIIRLQGDVGLRASELGRHLRISRPGVSQMLKSLDGKGFIQRVQSKEDRRAVYVRMTAAGEARYNQMTSGMRTQMRLIFERLGPQKVEQMIGLLNELSDVLESGFDSQKTNNP